MMGNEPKMEAGFAVTMERNALSRRRFLTAALGNRGVSDQSAAAQDVDAGFEAYTPNADFFRQQMKPVPAVNVEYWSLYLGGQVKNPYSIRYDDLATLPSIEMACTIACIGSSTGSPMIGNARWRGVPMQTLLSSLEISPGARFAQFAAVDGYITYVDHERLSTALLAFEMNGQPLSIEHGFPARLIVPGLYGYKMPKWIQSIEFTDSPVAGFWERRGWSTTGLAQTTAALVTPRHLQTVSRPVVLLAGYAYAGDRAITRVEVSINDGHWMPVSLRPVAQYSWTGWQIDWSPPAPGDYLIKVRATDDKGFTQPDAPTASSFPDGSTAVQATVVRVV